MARPMFDKTHYYLPEIDNEVLTEFVGPFCRLMFGYSNCDREIISVVCAATGNRLDEYEFRRGSVKDVGSQVEKFISKRGGDVSKIALIKDQISRATKAYALRNDLAHGHW